MSHNIYWWSKACKTCGNIVEHGDWSPTYNFGPMLNAAGEGDWKEWTTWTGKNLIPKLTKVIEKMELHPERFDPYAPRNGFGTRVQLIGLLREMRDVMREHPDGYLVVR